ncbi:MAG TPA: HAMP domain-containing protein, partial [Terriglobales bacterium]|nr:HAMP domain-containing protein [Terriglobales bacterium]
MSITKQLYVRFGAILAAVLLLLIVILVAVEREHNTKAAASQALEMAELTNQIRFQMMQNRLYLSNYLLSGDSREVDHMNEGVQKLKEYLDNSGKLASSDQQRSALENVAKNEATWATDFAQPMLEKRREVDAGNATVADLQIYYLQKDASSWVKTSTQFLDQADQETKNLVETRRKSDENAGTEIVVIALLSTLVALGFGIFIAFRTAKSITEPLTDLMRVAKQIGQAGDLDHKIDIQRTDEIGELGRSFEGMVKYLKEMAMLSEAIAGGNLRVDVRPRSINDTLGNAFGKMVEGLRNLVRSVRDAASQVASASAQVAGASDESAKISLQSSSAIDEVTSTMHEMSVNVQNMVKSTQIQASSVS